MNNITMRMNADELILMALREDITSPAPSPTNAAIPAPIANNPFISFSPSYFHF
jgi:hypothetical protein